jgi:nitroreductase
MNAVPPPAAVRRVVELAARAPSVHNTQPWRWRDAGDGVLELYADRGRQLTAADPDGRNLTISCGTALHHAQVAAGALGWRARVERSPEGLGSDLLARLTLSRTRVPRDADELLTSIERRCTDRRRFTSWPVPDDRLTHLASRVTAWSGQAVPLVDVTQRFRAELLINRAVDRQRADRAVAEEQAHWVDHGAADGVPSSVLPASHEVSVRRPGRFRTGLADDDAREVEGSDGLIVICSEDDDRRAWLRAGEGLSALWLAATGEGLSVVPLSHVVEIAETRDALEYDVLDGRARPLIVVRVGWQAIGRSQLPRTPRRSVDDLLVTG